MNISNKTTIFEENLVRMEKERTVIHLEIQGEHHYFGSLASMYDHYTPQQLGITYGALRNYRLSPTNPYKNPKCIIRKGELISKPMRTTTNLYNYTND